MSYDNRLELVVNVDPSQANAALQGVNKSFTVMERAAINSARGMSDSMNRSSADVTKAAQAAQILSTRLGLQLPEAVGRAMAQSKLLGTVLQGAFGATVIGSIVYSAGLLVGKLYDWAVATDKVSESSKAAAESIAKERTELTKLREEYSLHGFTGAARSEETARRGLRQTQDALAMARATLAEQEKKSAEAIESRSRYSGRVPLTKPYGAEIEQSRDMIRVLEAEEARYRQALKNAMQDTLDVHKEAEAKRIAEARRAQEQREKDLKAHLEKRLLMERQAQEAIDRIAGINKDIADTRKATDIAARNALARNTGMVGFVMPQTAAEQIAGGEARTAQRAKEIIANYRAGQEAAEKLGKAHEEAARKAEASFNRAADAVEGFVHRTFLTARSFSDVWKQALAQVADFGVAQFARMASAWWMGRPQGATATAAGVPAAAVSSAVAARQIPQAASMGGAGSVGGTATGLASMGAGLSGLPAWGLPLAGGLFAAGGAMSNPAAKAGLWAGAGLMGVSMLGAKAVTIGGLSFAKLAASLSVPVVGAIIGGAVGLTMLFSALRKSAEEKARERVKSVYGVDIKDKNILRQIVEMAKSQFGGNLDMAIHHESVAELVKLYAMTTGQGTRGMRSPMTPYVISQSGGSLYQQPAFFNGSPISGGLGLSARASAGITVVVNNTIDSTGAQRFLEGRTLTTINNNPRVIQNASLNASKGNYGRRESLALGMSPGTLVG